MAQRYEGKVEFLTIASQDSLKNMAETLETFSWPDIVQSAADPDQDLWAHFGIRARGTWVLVDDDGKIVKTLFGHPPKDQLQAELDRLVEG